MNLGGASEVDSVVMLGTPNHGTAAACRQMTIGASFLSALNAGDDTIGDVSYTAIATAIDEVVVPSTSTFLADDGNIQNVTVQSQCPRWPGHLGLIVDGAVADGVRDALRHERVRMNCWAL